MVSNRYSHRTSEMTNIETLVQKNNIVSAERWSPLPVSVFVKQLKNGTLSNMKEAQVRNIAYSLQYLQFIELELHELKLHTVIAKHLFKTYIITAMSIIEVIFDHLVLTNGKQETKEWQETELGTNEIEHNGKQCKCKVIIMEKLSKPENVEMKFYKLIDLVEQHRLIPFRTKGYKDLRILKDIRNKIHLGANEMKDSDYYAVNENYYLFAKQYLYYILTNPGIVSTTTNVFDFLKLSEVESSKISTYLVDMEADKASQTVGAH